MGNVRFSDKSCVQTHATSKNRENGHTKQTRYGRFFYNNNDDHFSTNLLTKDAIVRQSIRLSRCKANR